MESKTDPKLALPLVVVVDDMNDGTTVVYMIDSNGDKIQFDGCREIAHQVNVHDALVEALEAMEAAVVSPRCEECNSSHAVDGKTARILTAALALARREVD